MSLVIQFCSTKKHNLVLKDNLIKLKSQQIYQQSQYRSNVSSKLLGYQSKKRNPDDSNISSSKRGNVVKPSNSQTKYGMPHVVKSLEGQYKHSYMNFSSSQNKFSQSHKDAVNLSHQIDRTPPAQQIKKKQAGVFHLDVQLPPLGYQLLKPKVEESMLQSRGSQPLQVERQSAKQPGQKKLSYMVNSNYKSGKKPSMQKTIQSQYLQATSQDDSITRHAVNRSFSPNQQRIDQSDYDCDSPLIPIENIPTIEPSKVSSKNVGVVSAYGANTHQGLVRGYNEDRVSIILNMMKPAGKPQDMMWPQCSFFAVYDGHGGSQCAEFLRDNLHYYVSICDEIEIIRDDNFPNNPQMAIKKGFEKAEKAYLEIADSGRQIEKSGSCAVCALIIDQTCYVANVGDSRAIVSQELGQKAVQITTDHKPNHPDEEQRIMALGGQIYQSQIPVQTAINKIEYITGPYRVLPGRLAVSRTLGDSEAKLPKYNGIPNVISAEPDVFSFKIGDDCDFLLLGCDGIFDKMSTQDVIDCAWGCYTNKIKTVHEFTGKAIEGVMKLSLQRKSFDNVTIVLIAFPALERFLTLRRGT